eukprot:RCo029806
MSECIRATPEVADVSLEEVLVHRAHLLGKAQGLGPVDLVLIEKERDSLLGSDLQGYYHFVVGIEPRNAAAACSYFNILLKHQQKPGWFAAKHTFRKAVLCVYNAFANVDVCVEIALPGGVAEYAVDSSRTRRAVSPEEWRQAFLCSVLRGMSGIATELPAVKVLRPTLTLAGEAAALEVARELFWQGKALGPREGAQATDVNNLLVCTLKDYFLSRARYDDFIDFITPFTYTCHALKAHLVEALAGKQD